MRRYRSCRGCVSPRSILPETLLRPRHRGRKAAIHSDAAFLDSVDRAPERRARRLADSAACTLHHSGLCPEDAWVQRMLRSTRQAMPSRPKRSGSYRPGTLPTIRMPLTCFSFPCVRYNIFAANREKGLRRYPIRLYGKRNAATGWPWATWDGAPEMAPLPMTGPVGCPVGEPPGGSTDTASMAVGPSCDNNAGLSGSVVVASVVNTPTDIGFCPAGISQSSVLRLAAT